MESRSLLVMSDRLEVNPAPTPVELEVVRAALAAEHLLADGSDGRVAPLPAWRRAGLQEAVEGATQAPPLRSTRGATRA